ncbi:MAG: hypothetical protein HPY55_12790 [Firmicutes bacterium]|nr:hypothetical protein [Bacillota bacterium]
MLDALRREVLDAAMGLVKYSLVSLAGGNASGRDRNTGHVVITPSGMAYDTLKPEDLVVVDMSGRVVEGRWRPSVDTQMHLRAYALNPMFSGVIHTHSPCATALAVMNRPLPVITTTMANVLGVEVPVSELAVAGTDGAADLVEGIAENPAILLRSHGVLAFGPTVTRALAVAVTVEEAARIYFKAASLGTPPVLPPDVVREAKQFYDTQYGQKGAAK